MVFKRRDRRSVLRTAWEMVFPPGGWTRAFHYVKHRIRRLPDTPERIARGIWAGVFTSFTPFFGMHFIVAAIIARLMNGNMLSALMGTFFGNPLTYVPIGLISLETGHFLLGAEMREGVRRSFGGTFLDAWRDLRNICIDLFTGGRPDWEGLKVFFDDVFFPYLVGGLIPGVIAASVCYYLTVPLIRAYQNSRRRKIRAKFEAIKKKAAGEAEKDDDHDGRPQIATGR